MEAGTVWPCGIARDVDEVEVFAIWVHHVVCLVEFGGMELGLFAVGWGEGGFGVWVFTDFVVSFSGGRAIEVWANCLAGGPRRMTGDEVVDFWDVGGGDCGDYGGLEVGV